MSGTLVSGELIVAISLVLGGIIIAALILGMAIPYARYILVALSCFVILGISLAMININRRREE
jgi:hypothetical protein